MRSSLKLMTVGIHVDGHVCVEFSTKSISTVLITDDNSNDYDMDADMEVKWAGSGMFGKNNLSS